MAADDIAPDIVRRITDAADQLFEEGGRDGLPNVDAVRRRAHANMNHVSLVMRTWRDQHKPQPPASDELLPDALRLQSNTLILNLWRAANTIANDHLALAQAAWDTEKAEQEELRAQLAAAFDGQAAELRQTATALASLREEVHAAVGIKGALEQRAIAAEAESTANARVLRQAQNEITELRKLLSAAQSASDQLTQQLHEQMTRHAASAERNLTEQTRYAEQLGQARQEAAELRLRLSEVRPSAADGMTHRDGGKPPPKPRAARPIPNDHQGE